MLKREMPGNKITDKSVLTRDKVWALLTYADGSEFCFLTTLNAGIISQEGVVLEEGKLVRLDKKYYMNGQFVYRQFSFVGARISLWDRLHYTDEDSYRMHEFL